MELVFIFSHQLFEHHPCLTEKSIVWLIESPHIMRAQAHTLQLVLLRAAMEDYAKTLIQKRHTVVIYAYQNHTNLQTIMDDASRKKVSHIKCVDVIDNNLEQELIKTAHAQGISIIWYESPAFLTNKKTISAYISSKKQLRMSSFYPWQRKQLGLLLDKQGKPIGGSWSFDTENRKRLPQNIQLPELPRIIPSAFIHDAENFVQKQYKRSIDEQPFCYPTTHVESRKWLNSFLHDRLASFGPYEDAITQKPSTLYHSVLSPLLNCGLLTPRDVIQKTITYAQKETIPLNSCEGFIRQIIGWREYVRGVYVVHGEHQRTQNFFGHTKKMSPHLWYGTTGLIPFDTVVKKVQATAYAHHIERLMITGNLFLLCEIDPHEVYQWFMNHFIDAYDWVMVPNVYGMSQYADGGLITTKPYLCGSAYILRMSDYPKGPWCEIWDGLYWRFLKKNFDFFMKNPRTKVALQALIHPSPALQKKIMLADSWLKSMT